tara:strand:+ start:874 stop:1113 length:240 start_codon:yes stop_codon:yes gene_type:complete
MLTKKDYELIAEAIRDQTEWVRFDDGYGEVIQERKIHPNDLMVVLGIAFKKVDPNFEEYKFWDACKKPYPEEWKKEEDK